MHRSAVKLDQFGPDFTAEELILVRPYSVSYATQRLQVKLLITIGDRTVSGMVARDQMVGPWQVPVADCAVTTLTYDSNAGEAMAMGERTPLALVSGPASGRMAIGEALTNICAARIGDIKTLNCRQIGCVLQGLLEKMKSYSEPLKRLGWISVPN